MCSLDLALCKSTSGFHWIILSQRLKFHSKKFQKWTWHGTRASASDGENQTFWFFKDCPESSFWRYSCGIGWGFEPLFSMLVNYISIWCTWEHGVLQYFLVKTQTLSSSLRRRLRSLSLRSWRYRLIDESMMERISHRWSWTFSMNVTKRLSPWMIQYPRWSNLRCFSVSAQFLQNLCSGVFAATRVIARLGLQWISFGHLRSLQPSREVSS